MMNVLRVGGKWFFIYGPIFIAAASVDILLNTASHLFRYASPENQWMLTQAFNDALVRYSVQD